MTSKKNHIHNNDNAEQIDDIVLPELQEKTVTVNGFQIRLNLEKANSVEFAERALALQNSINSGQLTDVILDIVGREQYEDIKAHFSTSGCFPLQLANKIIELAVGAINPK